MMSDTSSIPVMNKPVNNLMEVGPNGNNLQVQALQKHPVAELQGKWLRSLLLLYCGLLSHKNTCSILLIASQQQHQHRTSFLGTPEEEEVRRLYGSGFAMKLATERRMALHNNMALDILTGNHDKMDFGDVLSLPQHRPTAAMADPHRAMEEQLGM